MTDKEILNILFEDAGVQRSALLAENIRTVEKYLEISEDELKGIQWVDKEGGYIQMITDKEIDKFIDNRDFYLEKVGQGQERERIESVSLQLFHKPIIRKVLKNFVSPQKAASLAREIGSLEKIRTDSELLKVVFRKLPYEERDNIEQFFAQKEEWDYFSLKNIPDKVETLTRTLLLLSRLKNTEVSISSEETYLRLKHFLLKKWFQLQIEPQLLLTDTNASMFHTNEEDVKLINLLVDLLLLGNKNIDIALLIFNKILGLSGGIPGRNQSAISTENSLLFSSLFLIFSEAKEFAVGRKLNSSLSNKFENIFEDLMSEFGNCRRIYDGGVDVVVGGEAFDIESGPTVMNKSMVDAFSAKQKLIQDDMILPDISTYKIALSYGNREELNSFMAEINTEIITGRDAWKKITGVEYSPEIVFAIARLVARIFGFKSLVDYMLCQGKEYVNYDFNFNEFLAANFYPIDLTAEAQKEISFIDSLLR